MFVLLHKFSVLYNFIFSLEQKYAVEVTARSQSEGIIVDGAAERLSLWKIKSMTNSGAYSPMSPGLLGKAADHSISTTS